MMRARSLLLATLLTLSLAFFTVTLTGATSPARPSAPLPLNASSLVMPGEIVVKVNPDAAEAWLENAATSDLGLLLRQYAVTAIVPAFSHLTNSPLAQQYGLDRIFTLHVSTTTDVWRMAADFNESPFVEYAEPVYLAQAMNLSPDLDPNDPLYPGDYAIQQVHLPQAWDLVTGSPNLRIAHLDTGVDYTHPDMAANVNTDLDYDFVDMDNDANDGDGHGTGTASVAAAVTNNAIGMAGTCWNCQLIPIRVGADSIIPGIPPVIHFGSLEVAQGIQYAATLNAHVITMSLGGQCASVWTDAVNFAYDSGSTLVAAAGNIVPFVVYPAKYERVIAVSATNETGLFDSFSSFGPEVDLAAPGINIRSVARGGGYDTGSGTSYATPRVAGTAALMLVRNPSLTNAQIRQILRNTAVDIEDPGFDDLTGYGLLNSAEAVLQATNPPGDVYNPPTATCGCVLTQILGGTPANDGLLNTLRRFRDEILQSSPYGQRLTHLYYRHSAQVAGLMFRDPRLAGQLFDLLRTGQPLITSLLNSSGQAKLSDDFIVKVDTFVHALAQRANPELRQALLQTWDDLDLRSFAGKSAHDLRFAVNQLP
ncbi:MAG: S8 family serine peptidase [Anaerolineales bacterium]|nr:S8 family serine peptidase [Anaerolineales bacterium]MCB8954779.1 S8 family serine peptidase [Ardenticatenales bacterium]